MVRSSVSYYEMMLGVPAVHRGWMSRHGHALQFDKEGKAICSESEMKYRLGDNKVRCLDLGEEESFRNELATGTISYSDLKRLISSYKNFK